MKKNICLFALIVFCFCTVHDLYAQSDTDARKELNNFRRKAQELRNIKSYRIKTTVEVFDEKGTTLKNKYETVYETLPPGRSRSFLTTVSGGAAQKYELITIDGKRYLKENDGAWKLDESKSEYGIGVRSSTDVKMLEETTFNGQPVKVYEETGMSSEGENNRDFVRKYWFTSEGELLKEEEESKNSKTKEISRKVSIYEFDPNIKIEAPIK